MKTLLSLAGLLVLAPAMTFAQGCKVPGEATYITDAQVRAQAGAARRRTAVDQMLRIEDLCKYNLGIGIIHRGTTHRTAARGEGMVRRAAADAGRRRRLRRAAAVPPPR